MLDGVVDPAPPAFRVFVAHADDHHAALGGAADDLARDEGVVVAVVVGVGHRAGGLEGGVIVDAVEAVDVSTRRVRVDPQMALVMRVADIAQIDDCDYGARVAARNPVRLRDAQLTVGPPVGRLVDSRQVEVAGGVGHVPLLPRRGVLSRTGPREPLRRSG